MKAFTKKILKKIFFAVVMSLLVAFFAWIFFHSIMKANITFLTILLIKGAQVIVVILIEHIIRDTYYKSFLWILLRNLRKGVHKRTAIHNAKKTSGVKIFYFLAWIIALNMKREIRSKRHHSTTTWKKILSYMSFGYY